MEFSNFLTGLILAWPIGWILRGLWLIGKIGFENLFKSEKSWWYRLGYGLQGLWLLLLMIFGFLATLNNANFGLLGFAIGYFYFFIWKNRSDKF